MFFTYPFINKGVEMSNLRKIKLKTRIIIGGKIASPDDKNKGIYELHKNVANSLVARKRAVFYEDVVEEDNDNIELSLDEAKLVADELGIQYNPKIGLKNLLKKIDTELEIQAEKYNLEIKEISIAEAMKLYRVAKANKQAGESKPEDPELLNKLKALADEADIEYKEDITAEELKKILEIELEKYASKQGQEIPEDTDVFKTWELIKEKLKNG